MSDDADLLDVIAARHGDESALRTIRAPVEPGDFAAFWRETHARTLATPLAVVQGPWPDIGRSRVVQVGFSTLDGMRVGGWLVAPADGAVRTLAVVGHGYGGPEAPDADLLPPGTAGLFVCSPGFGLSRDPRPPDVAQRHVLHGIGHRNTYLIRHCVAALWSAASVLIALHPSAAARLTYAGESFGGGLGALALPWDGRFRAAALAVPTFGHHPLRLRTPCTGSGEAVRQWHAHHPEVSAVLAYFDAAIAAARIAQPVLCAAALRDPVVPPMGQWAVANALPRGEIVVLGAGHTEGPGPAREQAAFRQRMRALIASAGGGSAG